MIAHIARVALTAACLLTTWTASLSSAETKPKKIVLIAGPKSHGPEGNRIHDYPWSVKLLKAMFLKSNVASQVRVEHVRDGWPKDETILSDADAIVLISDGRDGDLYQEAPHLESPERVAAVQELIDRGCGLVTIHFSTFGPDRFAKQSLDWTGGYFDWEENGQKKWYSAIETQDTDIVPVNATHAALAGVKPFHMKEEFYFNLRFAPEGPGVATPGLSTPFDVLNGTTTPLLVVPTLKGRDALGQCVAWARERKSGGRGFGTTCGHFYDNWQNDNFRKLVLNAILWSAHGDVPNGGVDAPFLERREICEVIGEPYDAALAGEQSPGVATPGLSETDRIRVLILAGNDAHKWHNWEKTTPAIKSLLEVDPRIKVDVATNAEDLAKVLPPDATGDRRYDVLIQNSYANWMDATPLSDQSRQAFVDFLNGGGGLVLIHFANGAWHFSLPNAGASDWPEYRKIVRRTWNHQGPESTRSSHDAFGEFTVQPTKVDSPLIKALEPFTIQDELYFSQQGDEPIEPLITATSKITKKDEPLAWTYTYGKARVFQTLLGHSEKTYEVFGPRELLRRAVAWCAGKEIRPRTPKDDVAQVEPPSKEPLVAGKFGMALNATAGGVFVVAADAIRRPAITIEAWARLNSSGNFNILVASEEKSSSEHWELYSYAGSGVLSVYLPGHGGEYKSETNICDGLWHHVAMQLEPAEVRLFVDGQPVLDREVKPPFPSPETANGGETLLAIGRLVEDGLGCDGLIDEVRIQRGTRTFAATPNHPPEADRDTKALWRFDALKDGSVDSEKGKFAARFARPKVAAAPKKELNHWGKELVGFDWFESDSVDGRWQHTQIGNFLACVVPIDGQPAEKGLTVKIGESGQGAVCYDTARGQMRAAWLDGFLKFHPARYGLIEAPSPDGKPIFTSTKHSGFGRVDANDQPEVHFRGLWRNGPRTVLEWNVAGTSVRESPWLEVVGELKLVSRTFEFAPGTDAVTIRLDGRPGAWEQLANGDTQIVVMRDGEQTLAFGVVANPQQVELRQHDSRAVELIVAPRKEAVTSCVYTWRGAADELGAFAKALAAVPKGKPIAELAAAGPAQWTESIVTRGVRAKDDAPYVVDTITIPFDNPYKALFFTAGHDFLTSDAAMICTVHGDVWLVTGIGDDLSRLEWKRFATGLFQPLGLVIRKRLTELPAAAANAKASLTSEFDILVLGRDHITRLHDLNADNEADYYEVFHEDVVTSSGGHDYVTCLESDTVGRLYYLNAKEGLVRVSPDGKQKEIVATGYRNPNGLGVGPNGEMSVAPQEGEWTPGSGIFMAHEGGYGGYGGPQVKFGRPLGYDAPLCWIPRRQDNSSGGQVWVTSDRWGPLSGKMLHLSYGQCTVQLVLSEYIHGQPQGGTVVFPPVFESGICRGRFSPFDGQLYLTGLRGWTTAATQDGCFQRMRYTGQTVHMPVGVATLANGLMLTFSQPLNRESAEDPDSYFAEQWNITYRKEYGSPDFKVSNPKEEGRDPVEIHSATLLDDQRTVFLEVDKMQPVSQFVLSYTLTASDGAKLKQTYAHTIHNVRDAPFDPARITRRPRKGQLTAEEQANLRPGVMWTFYGHPRDVRAGLSADGMVDVRVTRMASLFDVLPCETDRPFHTIGHGFLFVPLKGDYRFRLETNGTAQFSVNGQKTSSDAPDAAPLVSLHKGYNRFSLQVASKDSSPISARLLWSSDSFVEEPVPPEALVTAVPPNNLQKMLDVHVGGDIVLNHNCGRCHEGIEARFGDVVRRGAPSLEGAGERLNADWVRAWVLDPHAMRADATMPSVLVGLDEPARQQAAADLAAYVATLKASAEEVSALDPSSASTDTGARLYEDLGCIACHRLTPPSEDDQWKRVSLAHLASKFAAGSLREFLKAPGRYFTATHMPDFRLSDDEAASLASFLIGKGTAPLAAVGSAPAGDARRGEALFKSAGCGQCHTVKSGEPLPPPNLAAVSMAIAWPTGCLADPAKAERASTKPQPGKPRAPQFSFSDADRTSIQSFLAQSNLPAVPDLAHESSRLMNVLRCAACHDRDGQRSPRMEIIAEESDSGFAPEQFPALTWTGDRLRADWIEKFLSGKIEQKPRQWLKARMPSFPAYAGSIANGLAAEHGRRAEEPMIKRHFDPDVYAAGHALVQSTALDCRQCHGIGDIPPTGDRQTLIAPGINFAMVKERMREEFYDRWMLDPPRFDLNTRMPKLTADGKTTKVKSILDGDAKRQFDAIWEFLQQPELEAKSKEPASER